MGRSACENKQELGDTETSDSHMQGLRLQDSSSGHSGKRHPVACRWAEKIKSLSEQKSVNNSERGGEQHLNKRVGVGKIVQWQTATYLNFSYS